MKADGLRSVRSVDQEVRLTVSGFARMIERAGEFDFKPHPHMLRHACGFALASKGHDARALQAYLGHRNIQTRFATPSCRLIGSRTSGASWATSSTPARDLIAKQKRRQAEQECAR